MRTMDEGNETKATEAYDEKQHVAKWPGHLDLTANENPFRKTLGLGLLQQGLLGAQRLKLGMDGATDSVLVAWTAG